MTRYALGKLVTKKHEQVAQFCRDFAEQEQWSKSRLSKAIGFILESISLSNRALFEQTAKIFEKDFSRDP